jgi:hypothetical protein
VLAADLDLCQQLSEDEVAAAGPHARARLVTVPAGEWNAWSAYASPRGFGLLVLDGLMTRATTLLGRTSVELIGREDLIRPWDDLGEGTSVSLLTSWTVLRDTRLVVLDERFVERISPWPAIGAALVGRCARRARWLAFHAAMLENPRVDVRLMLLFWHLADRWGRVAPEGVLVPVSLTHKTLGRLVRAQRPSVTASLRELRSRGMLSRRGKHGAWILRGDPNGQLRLLSENA